MAEQAELDCVSCETAFDPSPNGGFCPNCDTPHPDYEAPSGDDADGDGENAEPVNEVTDGGDAVAEVEDAEDDDSESDADANDAEVDEVEDAAEEAGDDGEDEPETEADDEDEPETEADDEDETDVEEEDADDAEVSDAEVDDAEDEADEESATVECQSCDSAVDASAAFCPHCGEELEDEDEDDEPVELEACPDCGNSIDDESYCPNCGTDLDAIREGGAVDEGDADDADDDGDADEVPEEVVLEVDGEPYTFGDGDVFGRRDEEWLADLVAASGGREEARYLSSEHLEFSVEDDGVHVTDVSTNGTKLNGTAMDGSEEKLEDGDTLELADRAEIDVKLE